MSLDVEFKTLQSGIENWRNMMCCCYVNSWGRVLKLAVRNAIGPIATPDFIVYTDLPKVHYRECSILHILSGCSAIADHTALAPFPAIDTLFVSCFLDSIW